MRRSACVIHARAEAIRTAINQAAAADVVLIAGKGHEKTQVIGGQTLAFSDAEFAKTVLQGGVRR